MIRNTLLGKNHNSCVICFRLPMLDEATKPANCNDGDLRLFGAATTNQGRLQVCVNGAWGSVCDSQGVFTTDEAKVACRQLGTLQVEGRHVIQLQKFVCAHPPPVAQHLKKQTRIILTYVFR